MPTIKYDTITAHKQGVSEHPQKVMKELGYEVTAYEYIGMADCAMMEVKEIKYPLPPFVEPTDYEIK